MATFFVEDTFILFPIGVTETGLGNEMEAMFEEATIGSIYAG